MTPVSRRFRDDRGAVGGIEVLPFGFLVLVVGMLLMVNSWAVVDARIAVSAAAREGARAAAETVSGLGASTAAATTAANETLASQRRGGDELRSIVVSYPDGYGRCGRVTVEVSYEVPALTLPWIGGFGDGIDVVVTASELVDGYRTSELEAAAC